MPNTDRRLQHVHADSNMKVKKGQAKNKFENEELAEEFETFLELCNKKLCSRKVTIHMLYMPGMFSRVAMQGYVSEWGGGGVE